MNKSNDIRASHPFPADFVWGAATSAYQIEGAAHEDGRGPSIWDTFSSTPGKVMNGATGAHACDHYHRLAEDIGLMQVLGLKGYRFSISWPRILPEGVGRLNRKGLEFYDRLVDGLLQAGIAPFATLFHWDLPQLLQDRGGWPVRQTAEAFVEYVHQVGKHLGDRVGHWMTINEPWCVSMLSYQIGKHAPGIRDWQQALRASHHVLLAHGWATETLRRQVPPTSQIGIAVNLTPAIPALSSEADLHATRLFDGYFNRWFLDPLYKATYPADMLAHYAANDYLPKNFLTDVVREGDLGAISQPLDFLGINYYRREVVRAVEGDEHFASATPKDTERTDLGWEVHADSMTDLLRRIHHDYGPSRIYIAENGAAYSDAPSPTDGSVNDLRRIRFLHQHLRATQVAMQEGVPVLGYFVWSLMDNFEWEHGYEQRFGLVWIDYQTQQRIVKNSGKWYREVIARNHLGHTP